MLGIKMTGFTSFAGVAAATGIGASGWRKIVVGLRFRMQENVDNGRDHNGRKFAPYAPSTKAVKRKRGKGETVNMQDTGNMRRQLTVSADAKGANILLQGDRREVALKHQRGIDVPKREWFGYTRASEDKARRQYNAIVSRRIDAL